MAERRQLAPQALGEAVEAVGQEEEAHGGVGQLSYAAFASLAVVFCIDGVDTLCAAVILARTSA